MHRPPRARLSRRLTGADRLAIGVAVIALIAGIVLLVAGSGFTVVLLACVMFGLAAIAAVSLAFLLVGESEDREYDKRAR